MVCVCVCVCVCDRCVYYAGCVWSWLCDGVCELVCVMDDVCVCVSWCV
jgi:hypothetical protein